jgi:hypothetical protein
MVGGFPLFDGGKDPQSSRFRRARRLSFGWAIELADQKDADFVPAGHKGEACHMASRQVGLRPNTHMNCASLLILLLFLLQATGCASTHVPRQTTARDGAPPISMLPLDTANLDYYYPDASRRAKEVGEVVARLTIGANGIAEEPIDIDTEQSTSYPRLLDATRKIFHRRQFAIGDGYRRTVTASVVFQSAPCGKIPHAKDVNFHMDVCIEPRPNPE